MFEQIPHGSAEPIIFLIDGSGAGLCMLLGFTFLLIERLISTNSPRKRGSNSEANNDQ